MNETVKMVIKAPEMKEKDVSLSNLKDLHSRLMLIGGQMNEEQKAKEEISQFSDLFDEILKLKKLYRQHYKAGNVFFFNFQAIIFCDSMREISCLVFFKQSDIIRLRGVSGPKDSVKVLCKVMRDTLKEWKESVKKQRQHCPELNNFSNSQLVMLRRQLAELISTDVLQPETAMMLMSLSNNICAETLVKAARQCNSPIAGKGTFNGEIQSDIVVLDQLKGLGLSTRAALKIGRLTRWDRNAALEYAVNNSEQIEELENSIESGTADASDGRTVNDTISELLEQTTTTRGEMYDFELVAVWRKHIELQETTIVSHFLGIQRLGLILKEINSCSLTARRRIIPPWVKKGEVNFVVVPTADVLKYVLAAYVEDSTFPSSNEVLLCRSSTNEDDLMLFFDRMFQQREINQLYCVVFPERLASNICRQFEPLVERFLQVGGNGSLAMFSGQENFLKSPISGMWTNCHRTITNTATWDEVAKFVRRNIQTSTGNSPGKPEMLLTVYKANLVTSVGCGQGKSLLIQRQAEAVERLQGEGGVTYIKVPVYHSQVNVDLLVDLLMPHAAIPDYNKLNVRVIHIDFISNFAEIDEFLFELLVLGCISDSKGQIWRLLPQDLYAIEITSAVSRYLLPQIGDPQKPDDLQMFRFTLPTAVCLSPTDTLKIEERDKTCFNRQDVTPRTYDETELFSDSFQRCFYYLVTSTDPTVTLEFIPHIQAQPTVAATLMCLLTHIGIKEPSWMELKHFVDFLNVQLQDYESSDYCLPVLADDLPGFRQFVLSFLIEMAQDFATRSLKISEELADLNQAEVEQLEGYTIKRNWENQPHPYLFFNEDLGDVDRIRHTFSFFGCTFDQQGNLLIKGELYKLNFISPNLVRAFHRQKVNLQQDFEALPENEKLHLLQKVLGVPETEVSPDPNYQITADCAMKICAIHMRHR